MNNPELFTFTIDFTMPEGSTPLDPDTLKLSTNASVGEISGAHLVRLPEAGKLRAAFDYRPKNNTMAELQLRLTDDQRRTRHRKLVLPLGTHYENPRRTTRTRR